MIISAPYGGSYPELSRLPAASRSRSKPHAGRFQAQAGRARSRDYASDQVAHFHFASNPTGSAYTRAEIKALTDVLVKQPQVWVLTDDMYEHLVYDDFLFSTPAQVAPRLLRAHADAQRRVEGLLHDGGHGYAGGPESLIRRGDHPVASDSNPSRISQWASVEALNGPQDFIAGTTHKFKGGAISSYPCEPGRRVCNARSRKARSTSSICDGRAIGRMRRRETNCERRGFRHGIARAEGVRRRQGTALVSAGFQLFLRHQDRGP